jgi:hypothetical protein
VGAVWSGLTRPPRADHRHVAAIVGRPAGDPLQHPGRSVVNAGAGLSLKLAGIPNVVAVKQAIRTSPSARSRARQPRPPPKQRRRSPGARIERRVISSPRLVGESWPPWWRPPAGRPGGAAGATRRSPTSTRACYAAHPDQGARNHRPENLGAPPPWSRPRRAITTSCAACSSARAFFRGHNGRIFKQREGPSASGVR